MRASTAGSPLRGAVPASGCDRTTSPVRDTRSSGLAPMSPSTEYTKLDGNDPRKRASTPTTSICSLISTHELAGEHHLVERAGEDPIACRGDRVLPFRRRAARRDAHIGGPTRAWRGSRRLDRRCGCADRTDRRDPPRAVGSAAHDERGHDDLTGLRGEKGSAPNATGPQPGSPTSSSERIAASTSGASSSERRAATPRPARPAPCCSKRKPSAPATARRSTSASSLTVRAIIAECP